MQSPITTELTTHIFPPLGAIVGEYLSPYFDSILVGDITDKFTGIGIMATDLTRDQIEKAVDEYVVENDLEFLDLLAGYINPDEKDINIIKDIIYDLANNYQVSNADRIILVYRNGPIDGIMMEQKLNITPSNGTYFTVKDIIKGVRQFIDRWDHLVSHVLDQNGCYQTGAIETLYHELDDISILSYSEGTLTLLVRITNIYD